MNSKSAQTWVSHLSWARLLIIVILILGVFFRFTNLDRKVYWHDEAYTSLRISGYTSAEIRQQVFKGDIINVSDLQKYQQTSSNKSIIDTIKSLAIEDAHHPPLYYVIARFWGEWFGDSVAAIRRLSAVISLLAFPAIYWLSLELLESSLAGWIAVILTAVSPFHLLYAQEAREYGLWIVTILLSSASLLRAMRHKTQLSWSIYTVTVAMGLYTFLLSGLVFLGHGIYVISAEGFRLTKTAIAYLLASFAGLLVFTPWILVILTGFSKVRENTEWFGEQALSKLKLLMAFYENISLTFLDLFLINHFVIPRIIGICLKLFILLVIGYSIYFLCYRGSKKARLFILPLIGLTPLALLLPDLILEGQRSIWTRLMIPCFLGLQLAATHLFATKWNSIYTVNSWRRKFWKIVIIILISGGILSCAASTQAQNWWNKYGNQTIRKTAQIVNKSIHPLLVSDNSVPSTLGNLLSLSYLLDSNVKLQLVIKSKIPQIPNNFSDVFLYQSSDELKQGLEKEYQIKLQYKRGDLYQLIRKS